MFDTLARWVGTTGRRAGARCSGCSTASRAAPGMPLGRAGRRRRGQPGLVAQARGLPAARPVHGCARPSRTPNCTPIRRTASSTAPGTPEELVEEAARLDLRAIALTDHDGLYGVVRFAEAARELDMRTVFGAELSLGDGARTDVPIRPVRTCWCWPAGRRGTAGCPGNWRPRTWPAARRGTALRLRRTHRGRRWALAHPDRVPKGHVRQALSQGGPEAAAAALADLVDRFGRDRVSVELTHHGHPLDDERNAALAALAPRFGVGLVATTGAHFAGPSRGRLAMAMGAIRARQSLDEAAGWLAPLGGAHLRSGDEMAQVFAHYPEVVTAAAELGEQCAFGLQLIAPQLPPFDVPAGHTEDSWLRELVMVGAAGRYGPPRPTPRGPTPRSSMSWMSLRQLKFPGYFLVVHDITRFCRENKILCQGRGSAANSAVCYALGVTAVDPVANELLFERFLSPARDGPPDIDIDIESDLREQVIQYVYGRYGRDYAAQVANVITYRAAGRCGTWPARWAFRRVSRTPGASRSAGGTGWPTRPTWTASRTGDRPGAADQGPAAAHGHPLRRHGDLRPPDRRGVPGGMGPHGEPQRAAVGQGRLRGNRSGQVRPAGAGHAVGPALRRRPGRRAQGHRGRLRPSWTWRSPRCTRCCSAPIRSGCSRWSPARRWPPCPGSNRGCSTTWWSRWR